MNALDNILVDLDGTLVDPSEGILLSVKFALDRVGCRLPPDEELQKYIGQPTLQTLEEILGKGDEILLCKALMYYRTHYSETGISKLQLYTGIQEALEQLKRVGYRIFLVTLKPKSFARRIIGQAKIMDYFDGIYGAELKDRFADKKSLISNLLYHEGITISSSVMIGDRASDILAGKRNGLLTAGVTYGFGRNDELIAAAPDWMFESVEEWIRCFKFNKHPCYFDVTQPLNARALKLV